MTEFDVIRAYFARQAKSRPDVVLGIGDDAAIVNCPPDEQLAISTDMLVAGVHFPEIADPQSIGHKALAVNLSDMAAMGANPAWFTLNLSLPRVSAEWLEAFSRGLFQLAENHQAQLIGGDTCCGALTVGIQIIGTTPVGGALRRSGARPGDRIYVTGQLGDAALGLYLMQGKLDLPETYRVSVLERLNFPQPRVIAGKRLIGIATACIDISDGLIADLGHILDASGVGARVDLRHLPVSPAFKAAYPALGWEPALSAGDDYELCFTVPPERDPAFRQASTQFGVACACIGDIERQPGLRLIGERGEPYTPLATGFDHFSERDVK